VWRGRVDFDATVGPALLLLSTDAHVAGGTHTVPTFAAVAGVRLGVTVHQGLALHLLADVAVAASRERIFEGQMILSDFGLASLEVAMGLSWIP
jgi:hypothetical protein